MIGKKRSGSYPVYVYDATTRKKTYVGSREKLTDARQLEAEERIKHKRKGRSPWTVEQFTARWFEAFYGEGTRRPEYTTRLTHEGTFKRFREDFGSRRLDSIERDEALDWARTQPEGRVKVVSAFFNDAIRDGKTEHNPFEKLGLEQSRGRKDIHPLTEDEVEQLARIALERWWDYGPVVRAWVTFAAWVGCRPAEMFALEWPNLDFKRSEVAIDWQARIDGRKRPKTKETRRVVFPEPAQRAVLDMNRLRRGLVFTAHEGNQVRGGGYRYYWLPVQDRFLGGLEARRRAELLEGKKPTRNGNAPNLDMYELRHFCGSMLADRGASARDIAHQLGNSVEVCEATYIHTHRDRALERLKGAFSGPAPVSRLGSREHFGSNRAENA
jgi:integrase